jgi:hypothetical protein
MDSPYLSLAQAAGYLGKKPKYLYSLVQVCKRRLAAGQETLIQFSQPRESGCLFFKREWLDEFIERGCPQKMAAGSAKVLRKKSALVVRPNCENVLPLWVGK